jgi:ABC-type ATPase involved in cell division
VLVATHDLSLLSESGERCLALENGRIISDKNSFKRDRKKSH